MATWDKVAQRIRTGSMPPADAEPLLQSDREWLADWIDTTLHHVDCSQGQNAGSVTLRRLTRFEYQNTIRDLLRVDYEPAAAFPADDAGYGFDNIGDVMSLPPLLMEKYLLAAEVISRRVIVAPEGVRTLETPLAIEDWRLTDGVERREGRLCFFSASGATHSYACPRGQPAVLRIMAGGDQAGSEPCKMTVYVSPDAGTEGTAESRFR
jgi:hypothetical protein